MIWGGITFQVMGHRDGRMLRAPGLFAFCRAGGGEGGLMLFAGHTEDVASSAGPRHPRWVDALQLGMDELHVHLGVARRIDRLQLLDHVVHRAQPIRNLLEDRHPAPGTIGARRHLDDDQNVAPLGRGAGGPGSRSPG